MTNSPKLYVALTTSTFAVHDQAPLKLLKKAGIGWFVNPHGKKLNPEQTRDLLQEAVGVIAGTEVYDREILQALPSLKVISRCGSGMDSVDMEAAADFGITVVNTPFGPTRAAAELTVAMIMSMLRTIPLHDRNIKNGMWVKTTGRLLQNKRVGIVGYGRIGATVADLLEALGCTVGYADPCVEGGTHPRMDFHELLAWADIVTLHCSEPKAGYPLIMKEELARMQPGSWLVNCSRGSLIDEEALYEALHSGHLSGAAIDTFAREPYTGPLAELENTVLTPHVGSYALEGRVQMEVDAVANLLAALGIKVEQDS